MRPKYKFSSHRTRNLKNIKKQRQKYPDLVEKIIGNSDVILEILDARFIEDTRNKNIEKRIIDAGKKIIYVINKSDLVNERIQTELYPSIRTSCKERRGIKELRDKIKEVASKIKKENRIVVGILGYPNTGKSSLINLLIGKNSAKTGSEAGFTKGLQKLKLTSNIMLLDSPGVIPQEKYSGHDKESITEQIKVGAKSYNQITDPETIVIKLMKNYRQVFENYYKINAGEDLEEFIEKLGRKLNFLKKGNQVDVDKTSRKMLRDWQEGKIRVL